MAPEVKLTNVDSVVSTASQLAKILVIVVEDVVMIFGIKISKCYI